jgi:hypothetical protein
MNTLVKKSSLGMVVLLLVAGVLAFFACEKETLFPQGNATVPTDFEAMLVGNDPEIAEVEAITPNPPFDFRIAISSCKTAKPKVTLRVVINELYQVDKSNVPAKYKYEWVVNRAIVGRGPELACFCANSASVTVTRMADSKWVRKTVGLKMCNPQQSAANYLEE